MTEVERSTDTKSNFQLFALALENALFTLVVYAVCAFEYSPRQVHVPGDFVIAEIAIVLVALVALITKVGAGFLSEALGSLIPMPKRVARILAELEWKPAMVVLLTLSNVAPFALLVNETGGVVVSPFTPLLTVPSLFTAFQARKPRSILGCMGAGMIAFAVVTADGPAESPVNTTARPTAFLFVSLVIMFLAGVLSAGAKARENNLTVGSVLAGASESSADLSDDGDWHEGPPLFDPERATELPDADAT